MNLANSKEVWQQRRWNKKSDYVKSTWWNIQKISLC